MIVPSAKEGSVNEEEDYVECTHDNVSATDVLISNLTQSLFHSLPMCSYLRDNQVWLLQSDKVIMIKGVKSCGREPAH